MDTALQTHRSAVVAALLGLVGNALAALAFWHAGPLLHVVQGIALAVNAAALLILWLRRARPSVALASALFILLLLPTVVMVWLADDARAATAEHWVPYEPNKLSVLALAIIAPPGWWVGVCSILLFVVSAVVHHLLLPGTVVTSLGPGEPFGIIAYGAFALVLLGFRQRGRNLEAELARARAEKLTLERVAHLALLLRDLANTPTQTLELIRHELAVLGPPTAILAERMRRALDRLRRLNEILSRYAVAVVWDKAHASFDAEAEAQALLNHGPPPRPLPGSGAGRPIARK